MKILSKHLLALLLTILSVQFSLLAQISGTTNVCSGQTETYTTSISAATYNWNVTGAKSTNPTGSSITIEWGEGGIGSINLNTFDQNNSPAGSASLSVNKFFKPNPLILSSFSTTCFDDQEPKDSCFTACQFRPVIYSSPFYAGDTYTWEVIGNGSFTNISPNEIEVIWQTIGQQYIKLTVSTSAGCTNTFQQCVNVIESPTAIIGKPLFLYGQSPITICKNSDFYLDDISTGASGRRWDFGDGNSSDEINPTHSYSQSGTYQVILTVNNDCFCLDSDTITIVVEDKEGAEIVCIGTVCEHDTVDYFANTDCREQGWTLTGGQTTTLSGIPFDNALLDVTWNKHPAFLQYRGTDCPNECASNVIEKIPVLIDSIPIKGANPVCIGEEHTYSIEPIPGSVYSWSATSSLSMDVTQDEYSFIVKDIKGSGNITLFYHNPVLGCSGSTSLFVEAKERLSLAMPAEVCNNDSLSFIVDYPIDWTIINSSGSVVYNDTNTTEQTFRWSNFASGDYTLQLRKRNSYCNDLDLPFTISPAPIAPDSIFGQATICSASAYSYSVDPKSGYRVEWVVQGGTPEESIGNTVTINWYNMGPYTIKAAYRDLQSPNCLSTYEERTIAPFFTGTKSIIATDSACGGDTATIKLNFIADKVEWTVVTNNGGNILTDRFSNEMQIQFSASTTQNVTIRAEGELCGVSFLIDYDVFVQSFPTPTITFSDPNPCPNSPVIFSTNASNPTWLIDGILDTDPKPTMSFDSARSIQAQVTANYVGPMGCTAQRVNVEQLIVKVAPKAIITAFDTNLSHCSDTLSPIILYASLQGANSSTYAHQWTKNGTNLIGETGTSYNVSPFNPHGDYRVQITAPNGCVSLSEPYQIDTCSTGGGCPKITSDKNVTVDIILDSTNCSDFFVGQVLITGGATLIEIRLSNSHISTDTIGPQNLGFSLGAGYHSLRFEGSVDTGTDTLCFTIIIEKVINVAPDFSIIKQACSTTGMERYQFINTSTYTSSSAPQFSWSYGSNAIVVSSGYDPIVDFMVGTHNITLTAIGTTCSITKQITVNVPTIAQFISTAPVCQQELVDFTNTSSGNIIEYKWNLGGQVLYNENPSVAFFDQNNKTSDISPFIDLYILGSDGCRDTTTQTLTIKGNEFDGSVQALFNITSICEGENTTLAFAQNITSPPNTNTPFTYSWSNGETTSTIQVNQTGNYHLSMTDNVGCRFVSNPINIEVKSAPNPTIIGKQTFCYGDSVKLSILNHPSYTVNWSVNATPTGQTGSHFKAGLLTGTYQISTDAVNTFNICASTNAPFPVTVMASLPKPTITSSSSYPICEGSPITLTASPIGGDFYWNTGQTGISITQSLAGRYTVIQTDLNGCKSSNFFDINPMPDFSNFMTGCYCLPAQPPTNLLGVPDIASYQWIKDGVNVPLPSGTMQDLTATTGLFELIAVTDSGCVDTSGIIDVSVGGCDPCIVSASNLTVNCIRINGDSAFYDFTVEVDVNNAPTSYALTADVMIGLQPAILQHIQPLQISGTQNMVSGSFVFLDSIGTDSLCIILKASNPTVNCSVEICAALDPVVCDINANFSSNFDKDNCTLTLTNISTTVDDCIAIHEDSIRWEVTFQGKTYVKYGNEVTFSNIRNDVATICMTVSASDFSGQITCQKEFCDELYIPDCRCEEECSDIYASVAYFHQFIQQDDSCFIRFIVEIVDGNGSSFDLSSLFGANGTVLGSQLITANGGTKSYFIDFYPNEQWNEGETCFEFFITTEDGEICCITFCVELPRCEAMSRKRSPSSIENGLSSKDKNGLFNAYPNPTKNKIFVEWETTLDESIEVLLIDHNSKVVHQEFRAVKGNQIELNLNNYVGGVYVLEIRRKEITSQEKIVILR